MYLLNKKPPCPVLDSHVHIFPEKLMKALFSFFTHCYDWKLPFSPNPEKLIKRLFNEGTEQAFILAYTHKTGLARSLNRWLADFCRVNPEFIPFGTVHPADYDLSAITEECLDQFNFAGMKLHCLVQRCRPDDARLEPLYDAVQKRGKGVFIHAGSFPQPDEHFLAVRYIENVLARHPGIKMVIPHMGLNELSIYRELLKSHQGLFLDTAFIFQNEIIQVPLDEIVETINEFPDRVIYGSDYPLILEEPSRGIERILALGLSEENLKKLFRENALSFLASDNNTA